MAKKTTAKKNRPNQKLSQLRQWTKNHWWQIVMVIVLVVGIGLFAWNKTRAKKEPQTFVSPTYQNIAKKLEVSGVVDADEKIRLRFLTGGKVIYLSAQEGDWVKKYQTLAIVDNALLKKQKELSLNNYLIQRENWEQTRDDYVENGDGIAEPIADEKTKRLVKKQQLLLNNSVINVEIKDISVKNNRLTTPFAGILTHSPIKTAGGQLTNQDYFEVVNPDSLIFLAAVDEADIAQVKKNQPTEIVLDAYPDETLSSKVDFISYTSNQASDGSTVFVVKLPLSDHNLDKYRIGMNGDAYIKLAEKQNVLTLPIDATYQKDDHWFVKVKDNAGKLIEKQIQVGLVTDDQVEILDGLTPNDQVLLPS